MRNLFDVKGKIAVISGGMGQLGTQYTRTLLEAGAKVAVFDINIKKENAYFKTQRKNSSLRLYPVDITSKSSLKKGLDKTLKELGVPSVLINNAALDVPPSAKDSAPFEVYSEELWDKTMGVNLKGVFLSCQAIGAYMATNKGGSIINISSVYGNVSPDQRIYEYKRDAGEEFFKPISYAVSKAGIINLTRYLATYWATRNVRVNTLSLGGVFNKQDKRFLKEYAARVPLARMANEDEYNGAILFLASDASSYMTGANLIIDGGYTCW